eukprot:TRINITY_DN4435_c0_g1_i5.p1 TRINITY_DN4435_c0_g1~~TRINITY_DN4435_c0_g1_i5.p1  ORF type:complete len:739 (+),score=291.14 TRINITY_DN4435_c0_g1_i5:489-2705(+)
MRMLITVRKSPAVFVFESQQHRELCFQVLKTMQKLDSWNGTVARKKPTFTLSSTQTPLEDASSDAVASDDEDEFDEDMTEDDEEEALETVMEEDGGEEAQVTVVVEDEDESMQKDDTLETEGGKGRSGSLFKRGRTKSKSKKTKSAEMSTSSDTISALENVLRDTLQLSAQTVELDVNNDLEISPRNKGKKESSKKTESSSSSSSSSSLSVPSIEQEEESDTGTTRTHEVFNVFIGTWNMGEAAPDSLDSWIPKERFDQQNDDSYDMAVIGVQESDYPARSGYTTCESDWFGTVQNHLGDKFVTVASFSMWAIRLIVLLRKDKMNKVTNVQKASVGTGLANVAGNKGAVGISFNLNETSLCFVCSHLAAHQTKIADREEDYIQIIRNLKLGPNDDQELVPAKFHHLFFFGDLNYRIDMPRQSVISLIENKEYDILLKSDQLLTVRENNELYGGFDEGAIEFAPTYKMVRGETQQYEEKKERIPSYCDRIMWLTMPGFLDHMQMMEYDSAPGVMSSDHKPVFASFEMATVLGETLDVEMDGTLQHPVQFQCRKLPGYRYNKYVIHFWDVQAVDLVLPLSTSKDTRLEVEMRAPFLSTPVASQQSAAATEVEFNEDTFPMLFPFVHNPGILSKQHVTVIVHQRDLKGGSDKAVGTGVIALQHTNQESQIFECTLYAKGKITGELFGQVAIRERTSFEQVANEGINSPGLTKKFLEDESSDEYETSDDDDDDDEEGNDETF